MTQQDADIERVVKVASVAAAEVVSKAAEAALRVSETAAHAAHALAETVQIDLAYIKRDISEINLKLDKKYVTVEAFAPVRQVVYGLVVAVLLSVMGGVLSLVLRTR